MIETLKLSNRLFQCRLDCYTDGIQLSNQVAEIIAKYKERRPFHLNVIEAACHGLFQGNGSQSHTRQYAQTFSYPNVIFRGVFGY